ncbi:myb family transcription factor PHL12-like [Miscanthus floridulus]|uniref:myb family transcription factor PHL12-like n=1 Tax=Miscanthus floridulus TaxID=154761 RepID=UPI0034594E4B
MVNNKPEQSNDVPDMSSMVASRIIWAMQPTRSFLRWSDDLHMIFVKAVAYQGGPHEAKPAALQKTMEFMGVRGLTIKKIKSHLQKYREKCVLGPEAPDDIPHATSSSIVAPNMASEILMDTEAVMPEIEVKLCGEQFLMDDTEMADNNFSVDQVQMVEKELMNEIQVVQNFTTTKLLQLMIEHRSECSQTAIDEYMDGLADYAFGHLDYPNFNM